MARLYRAMAKQYRITVTTTDGDAIFDETLRDSFSVAKAMAIQNYNAHPNREDRIARVTDDVGQTVFKFPRQ